MKVIKTIAQLRKVRATMHGTIGFIPTMGFLHEGHMSLIKRAKKDCRYVIVSIFVNPKQFGPHEDFQKYPRDTKKDLALLKNVGTDIVFLPEVEEMYADGYETMVSFENVSQKLEGAVRPGHFTGVATVLTKLFHIVQATHAYFGQKDAQQVAIVKKMVMDLNFPLQIIVGDTVREADGLAMSSRNVFLQEKERKEASVLFQSLTLASEMVEKGETAAKTIKNAMKKLIKSTSGKIDYISIADPYSLEEIEKIQKGAVVSLAVRFGSTRLIDNIIIT